ncbi:hypothetical protein EV382_3554 [Micromonospora violae]|uniref:Uncharacterized protein n=1 Tax=Micromonospora violae TaxID=1278207 RepID=A0A4Q7UG44_9ACTN|nr:hypothetical protein EV382_3554 [Micromonospora violae]
MLLLFLHASASQVRLTRALSLSLVVNDAESVGYGAKVRSVRGCRTYPLLGRSAGGYALRPAAEVVLSGVLSALTGVIRLP